MLIYRKRCYGLAFLLGARLLRAILAFGLGGRRIFDVADQALQLSFADAIDLHDVFGFVEGALFDDRGR